MRRYRALENRRFRRPFSPPLPHATRAGRFPLCSLPLLLLASLLFAFNGCSKSAPDADTQSGPANITLVNLSNYPWQITFTASSGEPVNTTHLAAQSSSSISLPADSYTIAQRVELSATEPALTRSLTARFSSGQTYRWPLDTLLSQSAGDPSRMLPPPRP